MRHQFVRPLQVTCPSCYAKQWESCRDSEGYRTPTRYHYLRERKADERNLN
jgi:hypothetical protein